ncbi:MAG: hypothetical protein JW820_19445 [Spirochaetales bacterium]|nr:hypothetical protein [Spirochaetales bacterium]
MKLLVVSADQALRNRLSYHFKPMGFEVLHYQDPVKAIHSLEELDPEIVLYSAVDYPRHWKPMLRVLRERRDREECVFILLSERAPYEEAAKAVHLGVNGIVDAASPEKQQIHQLEELFRRYRSVSDKRRFHRLLPEAQERLQLVFSHPRKLALVTGTLNEISIQGASFVPTDAGLTSDLRRDDELPLCSLRIGDDVIGLSCRVTRNESDMGLQFRSFDTGGHHKLFHYIQGRAERELKRAAERPAVGEELEKEQPSESGAEEAPG